MPDDDATFVQVTAGAVTFGTGHPLAFILGPCVIESDAHALDMAIALAAIAARVGVPLVFKASFDKANRTSLGVVPRARAWPTGLARPRARSRRAPACRS